MLPDNQDYTFIDIDRYLVHISPDCTFVYVGNFSKFKLHRMTDIHTLEQAVAQTSCVPQRQYLGCTVSQRCPQITVIYLWSPCGSSNTKPVDVHLLARMLKWFCAGCLVMWVYPVIKLWSLQLGMVCKWMFSYWSQLRIGGNHLLNCCRIRNDLPAFRMHDSHDHLLWIEPVPISSSCIVVSTWYTS
jgi:hypothetical protein